MGRGRHRIKHERHDSFRNAMRFVGPTLIVVGVVMFFIGIVSFIQSFDHGPSRVVRWLEPGTVESRPPSRFWMCFVGAPIAALGIFCTKIGYLGAAARYLAGETAPVARDTVNYVLDGTKETIREVAQAVRGEGARDVACPECGHGNDADAKFCDECGTALRRTCPKCGDLNDADARFCDDCGAPL